MSIVDAVLSECGSAASPGIATVADELSTVIGVDIDYLRLDERLRDAFRIRRDELSDDLRDLFAEVGLQDVVDPFAMALLDLVEARIREDPTRLQRSAFVPLPRSEDEWVERILGMTVAEFLKALV